MSYIRESIVFIDDLLWGSGSFQMLLCSSTLAANVVTPGDIVSSEQVRFPLTAPIITWNTTLARNEIVFSDTFTPTADIAFNRVSILKDGSTTASWTATAVPVPANTVTIVGNDFAIGERFFRALNDEELTVSNVVGDDVTFTGQTSNFSNGEVFYDGRGLFLVWGVQAETQVFFNGVEHFIDFRAESITV